MPYVPQTSFRRDSLGFSCDAIKLFLTFLFSDHAIGLQSLRQAPCYSCLSTGDSGISPHRYVISLTIIFFIVIIFRLGKFWAIFFYCLTLQFLTWKSRCTAMHFHSPITFFKLNIFRFGEFRATFWSLKLLAKLLLHSIPHFLLLCSISTSLCTSGMRTQSSLKPLLSLCFSPSYITEIALTRVAPPIAAIFDPLSAVAPFSGTEGVNVTWL